MMLWRFSVCLATVGLVLAPVRQALAAPAATEHAAPMDAPLAGQDASADAPGSPPVESPAASPELAPAAAPEPTAPEPTAPEPIAPEPIAPEPIAPEPIAPEPTAPDDPFGADGYDPRRDSPEAIQARHWVRAGIVLLASGGALGVGALIIGASDPCAPRAGNSCQIDARRRAALAMGLPALALLGGGVAALAVGVRRQRRIAASVAVTRSGGRNVGAGVWIRGRF